MTNNNNNKRQASTELCVNKNMAFEWCLTNTMTAVIYSWPSIVHKTVIVSSEYLKSAATLQVGIISEIDFENENTPVVYVTDET